LNRRKCLAIKKGGTQDQNQLHLETMQRKNKKGKKAKLMGAAGSLSIAKTQLNLQCREQEKE